MVFNNLVMIPLVTAHQGKPDYLTLDEALARGKVQVTETSETGNVPELRLVNTGQRPVLLLDGEELVGAKQNRILNLTILAPARSTLIIPVSCVEAGRWARSSQEFGTEGRAFYAEGRARKARQVTDSLREHGKPSSQQHVVWADIAEKARRMQSHSNTEAMAHLYDDYRHPIETCLAAMEAIEGQAGAVFVINGRIRGLELFDFAATFRKLMPKLVRSYALDAIDEQGGHFSRTPPDIWRFLEAVASAQGSVYPAVGEGEDIRLSGPGLAGGALYARGRMVHLCAFHADAARNYGENLPVRLRRRRSLDQD